MRTTQPTDKAREATEYDDTSFSGLVHGAKAATDDEKNMTLMEGIRLYPKAIAWSMLISTCIAMEGYDLCLLGNFCECPPSYHFARGTECFSPRRVPRIQSQVRSSHCRWLLPSICSLASRTI
jgi:hypothetical protein